MRVLSVVFVVSAAYLKHAGIVVRLHGHRSRHPTRQQVLAAMGVGCRECPYFRKISRVVRVSARLRSAGETEYICRGSCYEFSPCSAFGEQSADTNRAGYRPGPGQSASCFQLRQTITGKAGFIASSKNKTWKQTKVLSESDVYSVCLWFAS